MSIWRDPVSSLQTNPTRPPIFAAPNGSIFCKDQTPRQQPQPPWGFGATKIWLICSAANDKLCCFFERLVHSFLQRLFHTIGCINHRPLLLPLRACVGSHLIWAAMLAHPSRSYFFLKTISFCVWCALRFFVVLSPSRTNSGFLGTDGWLQSWVRRRVCSHGRTEAPSAPASFS